MASSAAPTGEESSPPHDLDSRPSASLTLPSSRQALVNDIIELYCCRPTYERIRRYTRDCVYEDQFVCADDRYQVAKHWFALPHLFESSINEGYQVVLNDTDVIKFKLQQTWTFRMPTPETGLGTPVAPTTDALVTLNLDPETIHSNTVRITHHQEQAADENYNLGLLDFTFKKWQADQIAKHTDGPEVEVFRPDKRKVGERYWSARNRAERKA